MPSRYSVYRFSRAAHESPLLPAVVDTRVPATPYRPRQYGVIMSIRIINFRPRGTFSTFVSVRTELAIRRYPIRRITEIVDSRRALVVSPSGTQCFRTPKHERNRETRNRATVWSVR